MVGRRELMAGAVGMGAYTLLGQGGDDEVAQLRTELAALKREVHRLRGYTLHGSKIRKRMPDGALVLGDIPLIVEDDGLHFKDESFGDGLFWDAKAGISLLRGYSDADYSLLEMRAASATPGNNAIVQVVGDGSNPSAALTTNISATQKAAATLTTTAFTVAIDPSSGSASQLIVSDPTNDTEVSLEVRRNLSGTKTTVQATQGAADSGGTGFRLLRVPN